MGLILYNLQHSFLPVKSFIKSMWKNIRQHIWVSAVHLHRNSAIYSVPQDDNEAH